MADITAIRSGASMTLGQQAALTIKMAMPAILAQLSTILMFYIDGAMVGRLGANESASVGLMNSSLWLFWGVCSAATIGFSVQVAHRLGANSPEQARRVVRQGITSCLIFAMVIAGIGLAIAPALPRWLGGAEAICGDASTYFAVFAAALPLLTMNYLSSGVLRCAGNMKVPGLLNVVMCLLDVVLNFFLIFSTREVEILGTVITIPGAGLGVLGAAIGTAGAEAIVGLYLLYFMVRVEPDTRLRGHERGSFRPQADVLRKALKISAPMTLEHAVFCSAQIMITAIVAPLGIVAIAANAFAVTAESLCYMPGFGIGEAATTLVGQSHGAGRRDLVRRFSYLAMWLGVAFMSVAGILLYYCAPAMMSILTNVQAIHDLGVEVLRIEAWAEPLYAASIVVYGAFIGMGDTMMPAIMNFGSIWAVRIPLAALMAPTLGLQGVWIAMAIELCFRGLIFIVRLRRKLP